MDTSNPSNSKDFDVIWETVPEDGWLDKEEGKLLFDTAQLTAGPILEVGVYKGRSTALLASLKRLMFCVDPFSNYDPADMSGEQIRSEFFQNMTERGFQVYDPEKYFSGFHTEKPAIFLYRQLIEDWNPPMQCGFCYLDGDHSEIGTENQIKKALMCKPRWIACHDYCNGKGRDEVVIACDRVLGGPVTRINRMAVWKIGHEQ